MRANGSPETTGVHMRKTLAALTIVGLPFVVIAGTAAPAQAYECTIEVVDGVPINCNPCGYTERPINNLSRKLTGEDAVQCLH